jgi:hypothetical protein
VNNEAKHKQRKTPSIGAERAVAKKAKRTEKREETSLWVQNRDKDLVLKKPDDALYDDFKAKQRNKHDQNQEEQTIDEQRNNN